MKFKFSNILIGFLVILNILPVLAPIFMHFNLVLPAKAIYFVYSFACHQIHWRSLHIYNYQCAWCARDTAIWFGVLVAVILVKLYKLKGLKWYQVAPFIIPIALDGGIQTIASFFTVGGAPPIYVSTNLMRAVTGSIFGIGLGLAIMPVAMQLELTELKTKIQLFKNKISLNQFQLMCLAFSGIMVVYVLMVQIWGITSTTNKPANFLDYAVKAPINNSLVIERRKDGICPIELNSVTGAGLNDPFALKCFFSSSSN